jgi:hypothetical protein
MATSKARPVCCSGPGVKSFFTLASTTKARVGSASLDCTGTARSRCSSAR